MFLSIHDLVSSLLMSQLGEEIEYRIIRAEEVPTVVEWAATEGWNPGLNDGGIFHAVDPEGWFGAYHDGRLCGSAVVTNYDDDFSFAGFYIVSPSYRGKDIGTTLTRMAMDHAGDRCLGLDGVMHMAPRYEKVMGMGKGYHGVRFHGVSTCHNVSPHTLSATEVSHREIADFDRSHFPAERDDFIHSWISQPGAVSVASVDGRGTVNGLGVLRPCREGYKVGPLFASDAKAAGSVLQTLLAAIEGESFFIDVPDVNLPAMKMVSDMGLNEVFRTARMYSSDPPCFRLDGVFGVTSFELG